MENRSLEQEARYQLMKTVYHPKSIAVIGASSDSKKEESSGWVGRLLQFGYKGEIYPINPKAGEILGLKAYATISDVPATIDYAIVVVPRHLVSASLEMCIIKGVKIAHIYTAGFSEVGTEEGIKLQRDLERIIKAGKTRVIGPNCMGVYCPSGGISFDIRFPKESGPVTFISQTGVGGRRLIQLATGRGLRFNKAVSYGNAIDLNVIDFLEDAISDEETKLILLYLEGLTDGRRFFHLIRDCPKPVVVLKAGLSESGSGAVASHTASLSGSRQIWQAFFKQTGAISVESLEEAVEQMLALQILPPIVGRKAGLVGRGGGIGVVAADLCEREGLKVPRLEAETRNRLAKITLADAGSSIRNPVEIGLGITGVSEHYVDGLQLVASDPNVDFIITFLNPEDYIHYGVKGWVDDISRALVKAKSILAKPFTVVFLPGQNVEVFESVLQIQRQCVKEGIGCFRDLEASIRAVGKLVTYYENRMNKVTGGMEGLNVMSGKEIIHRVRERGRTFLTEMESKELMKHAGIAVNEMKLVKSREEAISASEQMGYPIVLKISSPEVIHKSDAGGVKLGLTSREEVAAAYDDILRSVTHKYPKADIQGVTVQKAEKAGVEIIVGMSKDIQFGPVLMFGLGGIFVEVLKDVSFRIVPLTRKDAAAVIREIRGYPLLDGYRGAPAIDVQSLEDLLLQLSNFVLEYPEIKELDLNPVFCYSQGNLAVDARVILES